EDALLVVRGDFLPADASEQAEVVNLQSLFPAPAPEFADRAVRVQHERRLSHAYDLRGQFLEQLAHLALQRVELNLPRLKVGAADHDSRGRHQALDFPEQDAAIGKQQLGTYRRV